MEFKKCQLDFQQPCADKGFVCLKSEAEKREYNAYLTELQKEIERSKFVDPKKNRT